MDQRLSDFSAITERPGSLLNAQQWRRIEQRYGLGAELAIGQRVLEISCGAGIGLGLLARHAVSLVGCDLTYPVLAMAQQQYGGRVPLACVDAQRLPFTSGAFDLVLSFEAIYYLPQPDLFLQEARRVLCAAGTLLIGASNPDWPQFVPGLHSVRYPNVPELTHQLQRLGYQPLHCWGALPTETKASCQASLLARARRWSRAVPWLMTDNPLNHWLKRRAYGQLTPLPAELLSPTGGDPYAGLTPIDPNQPDARHRVIFVLAQRGD